MSLSARELFLIVRAQNQASGVLRKVGSDISALGAKEQIRMRQGALNLERMRKESSLMSAQSKLRQASAAAALHEQSAVAKAATARGQLGANTTKNLASQIRAANNLNNLEARRKGILLDQNQVYRNISSLKKADFTDESERADMLTKEYNNLSRLNHAYGDVNEKILAQKGTIHALGQELGTLPARYSQLSSAEAKSVETSQRHAEAIAHANRQVTIANEGLAQTAAKQRALDKEVAGFRTERLAQGVHLMGSMGRQLQLIGGVGAAALGFAANSAAQLNTQATLAATQSANTVQKVGVEAQRNMDAIIQQMQRFPAASSDMAGALYDIFSTLNVSGKQGRDILVQVNKAAVAGSLSVKDATAGVLSVLSNFKEIPQTSRGVVEALNRSFAAVRFGRITMQQFQASLQTTAPAANQTGQSFNNLAGTVAFLTRALGASKASVGYARLLQTLTGTKMVAGLAKHGIAVRDAAGNYKQLDVIIDQIARKFPKLVSGQQSAQNFFQALSGNTGTIQASRAFTTLITNVSGYHDILNKTTGDNNEFKKSFDAMNQTAGVVWARTLNIIKSLWIELGQAALSTIGDLIKPLGELAKALEGMDKSTKDAIGRFLVLTVAIAGLTGVFLSLFAALGGAALIFGGLTAGPILAIAGIILGISAAVLLLIRNWDKIKPRLISYWPAIKSSVQDAADAIAGVITSLASILEGFIGIVDGLLRGDWGDTWNAATKVVSNFGNIFKTVLTGVGAVFQGWINLVTSGVTGFVIGMTGAVIAGGKLITMLKELETAYKAVAIAGTLASTAGAGGRAAGIGAGLANMLVTVKLMTMEFQRLRGTGTSTIMSLSGAMGLLTKSIGPQGLIVLGIAAVAAAFIGLRAIFGGHVGGTNEFLQQQDEMVQRANQVTRAVHDEANALKYLDNAAKGFTTAGLDRAQARLDVVTSRRALSKAISDSKSGGVTNDERLGIEQLRIDYQRARQAAADANAEFKTTKDRLTLLRGKAATALTSAPADVANSMNVLVAQRDKLQKFLASPLIKTGAISSQDAHQAADALDQVNQKIAALTKSSKELSATKGAISNYIKAIAPKATPDQIQAIIDKMQQVGKVFTPKQVKMLLDSKSIDDAAKKIHGVNKGIEQISKHHATIKINVDDKALQGAAGSAQKVFAHHAQGPGNAAQITADPNPAIKAAQKAGAAIDRVGRKKVKPQINTTFKPDQGAINGLAVSLGTSVKTGVMFGAAGLGAQLGAQLSADVIAATAQAKHAIGAKSPSKHTAKHLGKPMAQGVVKGFADENIGPQIAKLIVKATGTKKVKDALKQASTTAVSAMQDAWQTAADQAQTNFGDLFSGDTIQTKIDWGAKLNIADLTKDLKDQDKKFRDFNKNLDQLRRKGAPLQLIQQLRNMGPDANSELDALNGATKKQLKQYLNLYKKSQKDIKHATHDAFNEQRAIWTQHGRDLAVGILLGLKSQTPALTKYFEHLWNQLIHQAKKHNKSHSPSKLYAEEGMNIMDGLRSGLERGARGLSVPMPGVTPRGGLRSWERGRGGGTVIYQTINAHHSESLATTLRKSNFRLKHRNT